MAKKSRKTPRTIHLTKHQASRAEREQQQKYYVYAAVAVVIAILVMIPVFGWWREVLTKGDQPYATVGGESISITNYAKLLGFRQSQLQSQAQALRSDLALLPTPTPTTLGAPTATPIPTVAPGQTPPPTATPSDPRRAQIEQQYQNLQFASYSMEDNVKDELVQDVLIRRELAGRGVKITPAEVDQAITSDRNLGSTYAELPPAPTQLAAGGTPVSSISQPSSPLATLPGVSLEEAQRLAKESGLTWDEFRRLVGEPRARRLKLEQLLTDAIMPTAEQAHARHILLKTQEDADKALARLQAGEPFTIIAKEASTDEQTKDKGGDLGWFPRGIMTTQFEEAAFAMAAGELPKAAVRTSFGFHVIMVDEFAPSRPIEAAQLATIRSSALDRWLTEAEASDSGKVILLYTPDKQKWVQEYLSKPKN